MNTRQPAVRMMTLSLDVLERKLAQHNDPPRRLSRSAVFMDRDGTINIERGYLRRPDELALLPTAGEALRLLNEHNLPVIIITNQSALGRGLMTFEQLEAVNRTLWQALQQAKAYYDALYYCPHNPDRGLPCACRKPLPGLLFQAAFDLGIDLKQSFMIGDKSSDLKAGRACGCHVILVRTGWGERTSREMVRQRNKPDYLASTLLEASRWILSQLEIRSSLVGSE